VTCCSAAVDGAVYPRQVVSSGWVYLAAMILAYGFANPLQSIAAARATHEKKFRPALLLRLVKDWIYVVGVLCQFLGFLLAFFARRELPLFLVQASMAAGLGVTALLGVAVLKWRLPVAEIVLLVVLVAGVTALIVSAEPGPSRPIGLAGSVGLAVAVGVIAIGGLFAARLRGAPGSVALGSLAGLAFGAAAVASRPLAGVHSWDRFIADPLLYLLLVHTLMGQLLLGLAMQRGSTTAAVASMDAASAIPAAAVGLLMLGDRIWPGREWLAAVGFLLTLGAVLGLTRYAEPQHHRLHNKPPARPPVPERVAKPTLI
jgi:drug/metabolite transporter (DMT)-like permease